jgi:hypothetical protein
MTFPFVASIMTRNCGPRPAENSRLFLTSYASPVTVPAGPVGQVACSMALDNFYEPWPGSDFNRAGSPTRCRYRPAACCPYEWTLRLEAIPACG